MRTKVILLGLTLATINTLLAAPVSVDEAQRVAKNWMYEKTGKEWHVDTTTLGTQTDISPAYRIIKFDTKGWVIISSDDIAKPIIGYGTSAIDLTSQPPAFKGWMEGREKEIEEAKKALGIKSAEEQKEAQVILQEWDRLKTDTESFKSTLLGTTGAGDDNYIVAPLLWLGGADEDSGIRWDQNAYYNSACPLDAAGPNGHAYAGCVATAMGQIMRYHQYPSQGTGSHSYTPTTHPEYGEQSADFGATTYDWANMPLKLTGENSDVAQVLYHAGVSVNMDYGPYGSGGNIMTNDAMERYFGYETTTERYRAAYSDEAWHIILKDELDVQRPLYYMGFGTGGHAFIVDGYDVDDFYHFNWGWSGWYNGKYTLEDLTPGGYDFSSDQSAVIIIPPQRPNPDFNADRKSDILWRNSATGMNYLYLMSGSTISVEGVINTVADQNWQIAGMGDFNGNGHSDILWRNTSTGMNYLYFMNGTVIISEAMINIVAEQNWQIKGVADFNGDGKADILWRNSATGMNYLYFMDGSTISGEEVINTVADSSWLIAGTGDFNEDGKSDILWRNSSSGINYLYMMDGATITFQGIINTVADLNWEIKGTGDHNGDGKADILWRHNTTGMNYLYLMDGTTITSEGVINTVADSNWEIKGTGDYNGDGKADILWRNSSSGVNYLYMMDGTTITSQGVINTVSDMNWEIVN